MPTEVDLEHCPTCGQRQLNCGDVWPPSAADVLQVRCQLPKGHRSSEHWHPSVWTGTPDLLWHSDAPPAPEPQPTPAPAPPAPARGLRRRLELLAESIDPESSWTGAELLDLLDEVSK